MGASVYIANDAAEVRPGWAWVTKTLNEAATGWLTNPSGTDPKSGDLEPEWPKTTSECDSSRAFITHRISDTPGTKLWDVGHLGRFDAGSLSKHFLEFSLTPDQVVGQADGSVIVRNKALIRKRAVGGPAGNTAYYY